MSRDDLLLTNMKIVGSVTEQVVKLTEVLSRNSKNSHLPPSSDGPGSGASGGAAIGRRNESGAQARWSAGAPRQASRAALVRARRPQPIDINRFRVIPGA